MDNHQRYEAAEQHNLRVNAMVDIAAAIASDCFESASGAVEELKDEIFAGAQSYTDQSMVPLFEAGQACGDYEEDLPGQLVRRNLNGFAIRFATPVYSHADEDSCIFSWGHCYLRWVYGDTLADAWQAGIKWSQERRAAAIEKCAKQDKATQ